MAVAEKIQEYVQRLPAASQVEVLHFVEYLLAKAEQDGLDQEEEAWFDLSLSTAMQGMEDEETPHYTTDDLKVVYE